MNQVSNILYLFLNQHQTVKHLTIYALLYIKNLFLFYISFYLNIYLEVNLAGIDLPSPKKLPEIRNTKEFFGENPWSEFQVI